MAAGSFSSWWDKINESPQWQDGVFYFLCAAYALVSSVALVQLIRIQLRVPEYGWTTQKVFHFMNFIVNGVRAVEFGFHAQVFLLRTKVFTLTLLDLPGLLFFSTYTLLVLFWAEIYRQAKNLPTGKLKIVYICINILIYAIQKGLNLFYYRVFTLTLLDLPGLLFFSTYTLLVLFWAEIYRQAKNLPTGKLKIVYICINILIYAIQVCIWIYLWINDNSIVEFVGKIFMAAVSFIAVLGFAFYGGSLFFMLRRFPIESKGRRKKLHEVGSVTAICFACFLFRCFVVGLSAFDKNASLEVLNHPILDLIYYMLTEVLPSALVLYILRKLPPKRVSAQYHPIR